MGDECSAQRADLFTTIINAHRLISINYGTYQPAAYEEGEKTVILTFKMLNKETVTTATPNRATTVRNQCGFVGFAHAPRSYVRSAGRLDKETTFRLFEE